MMKAVLIAFGLLFTSIAGAQAPPPAVYFEFNKYELSPLARLQLDSFLLSYRQSGLRTKIALAGHCDFIGSDPYNDRLSVQRVTRVRNYLLAHRFPADRITMRGWGEKKPVNENKTDEERQLNRRVEIVILSESGQDKPDISLQQKIADSTTVAGTNITLKNINFYGGMHRLLPESDNALQELLHAMRTYPQLVIEIQGHICCESDPGDGNDIETGIRNLSAARAAAIRDYLITHDIAPERVSSKGFGHSQPLYDYPEQSEEERTQNRRVEIKIIRK